MNPNYNIYLDESGNDGDNLTNKDQPLFTFGGICIDVSKEKEIKDEIKFLREKYKIQNTQELKTKSLYNTKNGPIIEEIFNALLKANCLFFFSLIEKRFMICGRIIEDLFDPVYNNKTDNSWTHPSKLKTDLANFFYDNLSEETLEISAKAFQKGNVDDIKKAYHLICGDIKYKIFDFDVISILEGAETHITELSEDKIGAEELHIKNFGSRAGVLNSPNYASYTDIINRMEYFFSGFKHSGTNVIFDNSRQYNTGSSAHLDLMKKAKSGAIYLPEKVPFLFGFKEIGAFSTDSSENNILLQCADLFIASIKNVYLKILDENNSYSRLDKLILGLIFTFIGNEPFGNSILSMSMWKKF